MNAPTPDVFVPFLPKATAGGLAESFQAALVATKPLPAIGLAPSASPVPETPQEPCLEKPQVSLTRDGDRITGIRVQCSCGEVVELQCVY